ncbi:MAG: hypothetical protein QOE05_3196 [Actinomycetota bacterium]|jgi:hypothetical protein|nr:hypothetical protein [Actinomycetota bacterium]
MTRSTLPVADVGGALADEDVAVLLPLLTQLHQARADQREALTWLAQQADEVPH